MRAFRSPSARIRQKNAFTIIELLVALGVTAVMLTLMINISLNMLKAWNRTGGSLSAGNQARIALDYLSQDLQAALLRRDGSVWLAATVQRDQTNASDDAGITGVFRSTWDPPGQGKPNAGATGAANPLDLGATLPADATDDGKTENLRFGKGGVWLRFFTTPPDSNASVATLSAPRAVSYQMSRGKVGSSSGENSQFVYALFRSEVAPDATFAAGFNILDARYDTYSALTATTSKIRRPTVDDLIANNVVDFGVRLYERDTAGALYECFPVRRNTAGAGTPSTTVPVTYLASSNSTVTYTAYGNSAATILTAGGMPVVAELMVRVLTPEGQRLLHAFEEGRVKAPTGVSDPEYWWQLVIENSQVFTRRVEIRSTAL